MTIMFHVPVGAVLLLAHLSSWVQAQTPACPYEKYVTAGERPTGCLPPNKTCNILLTGITPEDQAKILELHNDLRNRVAGGEKQGASGYQLPMASNMRQLEWNKELEFIAQAHANQCSLTTDCYRCRMTESYPTGENIYYQAQDSMPTSTSWKAAFDFWERSANQLSSVRGDQYRYSAFTQTIWAQTKDLGCAMTRFKGNGNRNVDFYVCLYGPAGNYANQNIYESGKPCSGCFYKNVCCGSSCQGLPVDGSFQNLCKMK